MRSAPSIGRISMTRDRTTPSSSAAKRSVPSSGRPRRLSSPPRSRTAASSPGSTSTGVSSFSHESGTRTIPPFWAGAPRSIDRARHRVSKLRQKPNVVLDEASEILDVVPVHGDAIDAESEGEAGPDLRVESRRLEYGGVDHSTTTELEPADPGT